MIKNALRREISTIDLLLISFTAMFGSGWLFAPLYAAQTAGPGALIAWVFGAVISCVIGITMAEVITLFPESGGVNRVAEITHGKQLGFIANILTLIICIVLPVLEVRAVIQYLASALPFIMDKEQHITFMGYVLSALLIILINFVNIYGAKATTKINNLAVFFKLITPFVVCYCFFTVATGIHPANLSQFFPINFKEIMLAIATSGIIFSFNGFNQATYFAAEVKNPQKSIPIAIIGSIILTAIIYLIIQFIFIVSIPPDFLSQGWTKLTFQGDSGPFAGLAVLLGLNFLLYFIYADALISPLGTAFTYASAAPRMFYAFAKGSGLFPKLCHLNHRGIPIYAVMLSAVLGFMIFLFLPNLKAMISILVAAFVLNYTIAPISLLSLRYQFPELKRPFKVPFVYLSAYLSLFFSLLMVFSCGFTPLRNLTLVVLLTAGFGWVYLKKMNQLGGSQANWFIAQSLVLTLLAYYQEQGMISFSQGVGVIAVMSGLILYFAPLSEGVLAVEGEK